MDRPAPKFLPDPEPRERHYPVISVDDHLREPRDMFEGRLPAALQDRAPRRVDTPDGGEGWLFDDRLLVDSGLENVVGLDPYTWDRPPVRDTEMRAGSYDIDARVKDMDLDGVYAHMCFPGGGFGFAGRQIMAAKDPELGLATLRAYNDWHLDYLAGTHPGRIVPMQLVWCVDPKVAAEDIRRNAERGFKAATMPDLPPHMGLPRIGDDYWNPIWEALSETETVICSHLGSAGYVVDPLPKDVAMQLRGKPTDPLDLTLSALFSATSFVTGVEWVMSGVLNRYPELKLALSEGGIGWLPMAVDRLEYIKDHSAVAEFHRTWKWDETPAETLLNHVYFCVIDNPRNMDAVALIGSDHVMMETDYPHSDSTWPNSQELFHSRLKDLPLDDQLNLAYRTAERIFRHPVPEEWLRTTRIHAGGLQPA